ncbi:MULTISPECIES: OmpH family outer membrane protein [unclassified Myroides]|uniref:OmpH family outer membrane protein n=1 Tax=unclassified Myroides TaxID=2642485 RepID=UPI0015F931C0|nr:MULTISPECIES: OmpH family outer membrane protein [unclassified Myroides]MBB1148775.1 OmpH family outer membrane protein [Myroides sp. NP-2]MDM1406485.1 OmpH family outer membrane protein [Myroides sp. DF42-4-2]
MKKMKSLLIAAVVFLGVSSATAQTKVAHIDVQALITEMPAMKSAEAELKALGEKYQKEYGTMVTEYQTKAQKYQTEAATVGDKVNEERQKEVEDLLQRIQQFQTTAGQELQKKEVDLTQPIFEKARTAIQKVARAQGVQYVLDSSMGSGVLLADGTDLAADVKKELGIK